MALGIHPRIKSGGAEYFDRPPFEYACSDSVQNVVSTGPFDHDRVNARPVQEVGKQRPGWAGTDDGHLGSQCHAESLTDC